MVDNTIAEKVNAAPINLAPTLGAVTNYQIGQAHAGLYQLQALQQQRQYNALQAAAQAYGSGQDAVGPYLKAGGDPAGAGQLQTLFTNQRAMSQTPGGILPAQFGELQSAAKTQAETTNTNVGIASKIAGGVLSDPANDDAWRSAVNAHYSTFGGPKLEQQQLLAIKDPSQRAKIAQAYSAQGVSPDEANKPFSYEPGKAVTTAGRMMQPPMQLQPGQQGQPGQPGQQGGVPAQAPGGPQPIIPGLTPQQREMQTQTAAKSIDYLQGEGNKTYTNAQTLLGSMVNVDHDIEQLGPAWMGAGAETKAQMAKIWNSTLDTAGIDGGHIDPGKVANWEEFNKEQTRAGMQLINSNFGGSREAASIIQMGRSATPGVSNTYLGAKYVSSTIKAAAQRQVDLYEYQAQHPDQLPAVSAIQFNKANPPQQYAMRGIADVIPDGAKQDLMRLGPSAAPAFNKHFGKGMAEFILGSAK